MEKQKETAENIDPTIIGWEIDYQAGMLYARYDGPMGTIVGIDLKTKKIIEAKL